MLLTRQDFWCVLNFCTDQIRYSTTTSIYLILLSILGMILLSYLIFILGDFVANKAFNIMLLYISRVKVSIVIKVLIILY
jgi:hypothetical protein